MPFLGEYYPGIGVLSPEDIHRGQIVTTLANGFVFQDASGKTLFVIVQPKTNLPFGAVFKDGDMVVVFGDESATGTIVAIGVEKVAD